MVMLAWELAWLTRFNFSIPAWDFWLAHLKALPWVVLIQGIILWRFSLYRGLWRFASLLDLWNIIRAALLGVLCITLVLFVLQRLEYIPRSVLILYPVFLIFLWGAPRFVRRLWNDGSLNLKTTPNAQRVLIIGAGRAGEMVAREIVRDGNFIPVGFLDDRLELTHRRIHGIPVLGAIDALSAIIIRHEIELLLITIPSATNAEMQRIVEVCQQSNKPFRILPMTCRVALSELRVVSIEDLLGRARVALDWQTIHRGVNGKTIMVSGGGGSIGSELCNQIAKLGPATLVVFERSEHNMYTVERQLRQAYPHLSLQAVLGDVCDPVAVDRSVARFKPEIIFHAAAYKHVPLLELQLREAVRNNVIGTKLLAEAAARHRCEKFVLISSDKAVNPASMMGMSKRLAEMVCTAMNQETKTRYITVRFGNVLGSAGSVVPLFQEQIRTGGPVTVTHKEATRYFMTIAEACQLILQAGAMGQGSEIFVLDMGEPIRIAYLAEQMIKLSGKAPGKDINIEFIGLRPGERLNEELFHPDEKLEPTPHSKIKLARQRTEAALQVRLREYIAELEEMCERYEEDQLRSLMLNLVQARPKSEPSKVVSLR